MFRWIALTVFTAAIGISAWQRTLARRRTGVIPRSRESRGLIAGRLVVALPLFGAVLAYLARPELMSWSSMDFPPWLRWMGAGLGAAAVPGVYWVLSNLGSNVSETVLTKEHHELVTSGPYRWVRHPLYAVGIALFASIGLMAANAFILLWTVLALAGVLFVVIPREERGLVLKFGDDYRRYRAQTGALLPRLGAGGAAR